jgi:hypothetical protein
LRLILTDGALDREEQGELLVLISKIARPPSSDGTFIPSSLPLDDPFPGILFQDRSFCFTGVFDYGSRAECHAATTERGGIPLKGVTKKLHYLVIGNIGSEVWKQTSFGLKISKAVDYRDSGMPLAIVSESHWIEHINKTI